MRKIPSYLPIATNNIRRWLNNPRIFILAALLFILLWEFLHPILAFSNAVGYRVSPWLFPFLSSYSYTQRIMMFGIVLLFCDAPFAHEGQPYVIIRSGRIHWTLGQLLYIVVSTALYFLFINILICLILFPNLVYTDDWGKVLSTLAQTSAAQEFHIGLPINYAIQLHYTPISAFLISFLLEWLVGIILGLIIFIVNLYCNRQALGAAAGAAVVLLDIVIHNDMSDFIYHFSPVSMARLTILDTTGLNMQPTILYSFLFCIGTIIALAVIAVLSVRKREIRISRPV